MELVKNKSVPNAKAIGEYDIVSHL